MVTELPMGITADRGEREHHRQHRRDGVEQFVDVRRRDVFLEQELDAVGQRLQQAKWADPRGPPAILHVADDLALQPHGVRPPR